MKFEELLNGKDISELTDEEINNIVEQLETKDLEKFQLKVQGIKAKKPRTATVAQKKREDEFEALMLKGAKK